MKRNKGSEDKTITTTNFSSFSTTILPQKTEASTDSKTQLTTRGFIRTLVSTSLEATEVYSQRGYPGISTKR